MAYRLSEQEREVLASLVSGYTERETYLKLGLSGSEFDEVWLRIKAEFESNAADTMEETDLRHAYHRVERRRLEAELWASEARLAALMDILPDAVLVVDGRSGKIQQANHEAARLFGYTLRELLGREMEMLVGADLRKIHVAYRQGFLNSVRKREMGYHPPILAVRKDGSEIRLDIALTATSATDDVMVVCQISEPAAPASLKEDRPQSGEARSDPASTPARPGG